MKCCHDVELLRALVSSGAPRAFGLEAGSKAELLLAVAVMRSCADVEQTKKDAQTPYAPLLVCNGYKDASYVRVAFEAAAAGTRVAMLEGLGGEVYSVAFSPTDGSRLASGNEFGEVRVVCHFLR